MPYLTILYLSNNQIEGPIPNSLCHFTSLVTLDLQNNSLTGVIPNCWGLGQIMPNLQGLILSNNQIKGPIPESLCQLTSLIFVDIQNNSLSGEISDCWANTTLSFVRLSYNKLKGRIPCFNNIISKRSEISDGFYLHLNHNMLSGGIPSCLSDHKNLKVLDMGKTMSQAKFPSGLVPKILRNLKYLGLEETSLPALSLGRYAPCLISKSWTLGIIILQDPYPRCFSNLIAMTSPDTSSDNFLGDVSEVIQGIERTYTSTLPYLVDIDLSFNKLVGSIPDDMTKISGLMSLNLSYNQLSGTIPENIGGLNKLISLDLSMNKLRGSIPASIGQIYTLRHLNLSYNNLSGRILTGIQLQTLSDQALIYAGNPYVCGDALPMKCKIKINEQGKGRSDESKGDNEEKLKKIGFDLVVMSGFATGFWGVVGCLVLNRRWRYAFFKHLEDGYNWLYVKVRVAKAKINRR
ncbi:receptor-like protein EIX2 [Silene latifolia]|uniref:receptor-like protein EIX2 n=1 Tax=Silene latifolia TaxID=37657 RepID=UPI003D77472E